MPQVFALRYDPKAKQCVNEAGEHPAGLSLPCATVDASHGKGNLLAYTPESTALALEGEATLRRLFDFNRKAGMRAALGVPAARIHDPYCNGRFPRPRPPTPTTLRSMAPHMAPHMTGA